MNADLKQTDLSKRLRHAAANFTIENSSGLLLQAADEIERYYTGMLNWKATAEAKDVTAAERISSAGSAVVMSDEQIFAIHDATNDSDSQILAFARAILSAAAPLYSTDQAPAQTAAAQADTHTEMRSLILGQAVMHHHGIWPAQLSSGVMFFNGERITMAEFDARAAVMSNPAAMSSEGGANG